VLPADNGSPMKGATLLATRQRLGVVPAFSRPAVSNDNPYSEALFTTLQYQPDWPAQPFDGLARARRGVEGCVGWYNEHHRHRALKFVTPGQRHRGEDHALLARRRHLRFSPSARARRLPRASQRW
jgi:putative transposase